MPVDDREIFLLEADGTVGCFVHRRKGVRGVHRLVFQAFQAQVPGPETALEGLQADFTAAQAHRGILVQAEGLFRLRVADDVDAADLHGNVLPPDSHFEGIPLPFLAHAAVQVADMEQRAAPDRTVDGAVGEQYGVAASGTVIVEDDRSDRGGIQAVFSAQAERRNRFPQGDPSAFLQVAGVPPAGGEREQHGSSRSPLHQNLSHHHLFLIFPSRYALFFNRKSGPGLPAVRCLRHRRIPGW